MRGPMELVPEPVIVRALVDAWGPTVDGLAYLPEGAGAYHWVATVGERRWFVTCDDLDTKPWLGGDRDAVFAGLGDAYRTATELRSNGLAFVSAPDPSRSGEAAVRLDDRHSLAVSGFVEGRPGRWGTADPGTVADLVPRLAELHRADHPVGAPERSHLALAGRGQLEAALDDLGGRWDAGPLGEPARQVLAHHADDIIQTLHRLDQVAAERRHEGRLVVTHGEPHPGNLIRTSGGLVLVDWDTVAIAPPERDLWMIADDEAAVSDHHARTGMRLDPILLAAYRSLWALADIVAGARLLRAEHGQGPTRRARSTASAASSPASHRIRTGPAPADGCIASSARPDPTRFGTRPFRRPSRARAVPAGAGRDRRSGRSDG